MSREFSFAGGGLMNALIGPDVDPWHRPWIVFGSIASRHARMLCNHQKFQSTQNSQHRSRRLLQGLGFLRHAPNLLLSLISLSVSVCVCILDKIDMVHPPAAFRIWRLFLVASMLRSAFRSI